MYSASGLDNAGSFVTAWLKLLDDPRGRQACGSAERGLTIDGHVQETLALAAIIKIKRSDER